MCLANKQLATSLRLPIIAIKIIMHIITSSATYFLLLLCLLRIPKSGSDSFCHVKYLLEGELNHFQGRTLIYGSVSLVFVWVVVVVTKLGDIGWSPLWPVGRLVAACCTPKHLQAELSQSGVPVFLILNLVSKPFLIGQRPSQDWAFSLRAGWI